MKKFEKAGDCGSCGGWKRGERALGLRGKFWFGFGGGDGEADLVVVAEPDKSVPDAVVGGALGRRGRARIVAAHCREKGCVSLLEGDFHAHHLGGSFIILGPTGRAAGPPNPCGGAGGRWNAAPTEDGADGAAPAKPGAEGADGRLGNGTGAGLPNPLAAQGRGVV